MLPICQMDKLYYVVFPRCYDFCKMCKTWLYHKYDSNKCELKLPRLKVLGITVCFLFVCLNLKSVFLLLENGSVNFNTSTDLCNRHCNQYTEWSYHTHKTLSGCPISAKPSPSTTPGNRRSGLHPQSFAFSRMPYQ